jgi:heme-degrading monooxygenase HmoA
MVMVILNYPNLKPTLKDLKEYCKEWVPKLEAVPGIVDKTWGINEETGQGVSVYHFEDRAAADAWFNSQFQKDFRTRVHATIQYYEIGGIVFKQPLKK